MMKLFVVLLLGLLAVGVAIAASLGLAALGLLCLRALDDVKERPDLACRCGCFRVNVHRCLRVVRGSRARSAVAAQGGGR